MKRHWVCLQLRFEASKDVTLEMLSCRAALSGNTSLLLLPSLVKDIVCVNQNHTCRYTPENSPTESFRNFGVIFKNMLCFNKTCYVLIERLDKNSGPIVSRLWTKVHEILRQCTRPFILPNARLFISRFIQKIFAIKSRSRRQTEQM